MGTLLTATATHISEQAKIDAGRITTASGNEKRGSASALQNFSASLGNLRLMRAAGSDFNDNQGNIARRMEAASSGPIRQQLAAAEELGSVAAMAGAAGTGGSLVETYNETVRLNTAMQREGFDRSVSADAWASGQLSGNIIANAAAGLDNNQYRADMDYRQYVDHKAPSFFEKVVGIGLTAAATVFGGPQAGAAVMGVFEARQAARNGDLAGASNSLTGSFQNGMAAGKSAWTTRSGPQATAPASTPTGFNTGTFNPSVFGTAMGTGTTSQPNNPLGSIIIR